MKMLYPFVQCFPVVTLSFLIASKRLVNKDGLFGTGVETNLGLHYFYPSSYIKVGKLKGMGHIAHVSDGK
jgi:hypothetical protein